MSTILDQLNSEDDDVGRVEHLENDLRSVRRAFGEYMSTTQDLELGMNKELSRMQGKLKHSTSANGALAKQLQSMEPMLKNLKLSLDNTKERLRTESKMRRQAEMARLESESRYEALQAKSKNKSLRLDSSIQMRQVERNDSLPLRMVDSGVITEMVSNTSKGFAGRARDHSQVQEILDELETVTEQLDSTKQKLKKTEDEFQKSQTLVEDLERNLQKIDSHDTSQDNYGDDKTLLRELEEIRAEIDAAKSEIQSECTSTVQQDLGEGEKINKELMKENSTLREEVACLRDILYDQDGRGGCATNVKSEKAPISKVLEEANIAHDEEMNALRAEFEKVSNENTLLQDKTKKLINKNASSNFSNDEFDQLKKEVDKLKDELQMVEDNHKRAIIKKKSSSNFSNDEFDQLKEEVDRLNDELKMAEDDHRKETKDTEAFWRRKNQQGMRTEKSDPENVRKLREAECSEMRSEILALTESLYDAQQSRTYLINELDIVNRLNMDFQLQNREQRDKMKQLEDALLDTQKVVEVKEKQIINLGNNLMSTQEEVRLLSEEMSHMNSAFEKAQEEYNVVIEELDTVGILLEKSNKEAETCNGVEEAQKKGILQHNEDLRRKLEETENALAAARDLKISHELKMEKLESETATTPEKNAEISLLRAQFKKINEKNEDFARQVKEAENEVLLVREKQGKFINDTKTRADMAKELKDEIDHVSGEANKQNQEVDELTIMMENRMNLTEESLEMLEKEVSVVIKTLQTSQVVSIEESELFTPMLGGNSVSISDQYITTQKNETVLTKSIELEVRRDQKTTNEWLVHKFQHEKDEKVKAAIAATMAYVFAASPKKGNGNGMQDGVIFSSINENDTTSTDTILTEIKEKGISAGGDERESSFKDSYIHMRTNKETSPSLKSYKNRKLLVESKIDEEDRDSATIATVNIYENDKSTDTILTEIEDTGTSAGGDEREPLYKETDIHMHRNRETSPSLKSYKNKRLLVESKIDEKDRDSATNATVNIYDINRYIYNFKSNKNHERSIHKVANNLQTITLSEQDIENESRGDVGTEERE
mmetsp:Transcript_12035/g.13499  ORF Transcript_12035/g.13499 Transcript_12035/m.13499 type:complete len:1061 (+) Transcript_12035:118-3300(+)